MTRGTAPLAPGSSTLALAARALARVTTQGCTAEDALESVSPPLHERGAVRAILAGSLRHYLSLAPLVDALLSQPGRAPQPLLQALLVCAAHQIRHSRAAPESAVNIAVDASRALGHASAAGFVNAVLRRLLREADARLAALCAQRPAVATAHPPWLLRAWQAAWGEEATAGMVAAGNESPPMVLRVDLQRLSREAWLDSLAAAGLSGEPGLGPAAVVLAQPVPVDRLPGFAEGQVSVQDAGAQCAALLLDAQSGERVLDACAAPGGKTGHLLEHTPGLSEVVALDSDPARLERVADNLQRLGREARLVCADLRAPPTWWDGRPFDRILLDAPCSGTGVIRRHPDIKLLRRATDIAGFAATQRELVAAALPLLKPGGRLLYATCSTLPAENHELVASLPAVRDGRLRLEFEQQLLPQPMAVGAATVHDGFYYACLTMGEQAGHAG